MIDFSREYLDDEVGTSSLSMRLVEHLMANWSTISIALAILCLVYVAVGIYNSHLARLELMKMIGSTTIVVTSLVFLSWIAW